jgi:hypothetical protein
VVTVRHVGGLYSMRRTRWGLHAAAIIEMSKSKARMSPQYPRE